MPAGYFVCARAAESQSCTW